MNQLNDTFRLIQSIISGLMQERGKSYGVYSLEVKKWDSSGRQFSWHVYRRYSDFLELNNTIKDAVRILLSWSKGWKKVLFDCPIFFITFRTTQYLNLYFFYAKCIFSIRNWAKWSFRRRRRSIIRLGTCSNVGWWRWAPGSESWPRSVLREDHRVMPLFICIFCLF
jgi:hypothetical protein